MDFFARQTRTRRASGWLVVVFAMVMALAVMSIHVFISGLYYYWQESPDFGDGLKAIIILAMIYTAMVLGGVFRYIDVRGGGACTARRFGATPACDRERAGHDKRLLQVVAEMAIASGHPAPEVYVMRNQRSINAFVVGHDAGGFALVVTQGALQTLDRDELQAVVAHEFAHLVHGDVRLNTYMLVVLGGLLALEEIGLKLADFTVRHRSSSNAMANIGIGWFIRMLGMPGLIAGRIVQAAVTRQREYLADATAVQFTRYPEALASALDVIDRNDELPALHSSYASELAHLCFHEGALHSRYRRWLASHPTLEQRIQAISPGFDRRRRRTVPPDRTDWRSQPQVSSQTLQAAGALAMVGGSPLESAAGYVSGNMANTKPRKANGHSGAACNAVDAHGVAIEGGLSAPVSDALELSLGASSDRLVALFALLATVHPGGMQAWWSAVGSAHGARFAERARQIGEVLEIDIREHPQAMIAWLCGHLQTDMDYHQRQRLMCNIEQLAETEGQFSVLQYAVLQVIRRQLGVEFPLLESVAEQGNSLAHRQQVKSFEAMGKEFALLLSLMIESSGASDAEQEVLFNNTLRCYTRHAFVRRTGTEPGVHHELEDAFQTLYAQPRLVREAFVRHCQEIALDDGRVEAAEAAILNLFRASLDCSLPQDLGREAA